MEATLGLIGEALKGIEQRNFNVLAYPNVLGIQSMSTSEYVIRIAASCAPNARDAAERQIQNDIKQALEKQSMLELAQAEEEARKKAEAEAKAEIDLAKTEHALEVTGSANTGSRRQIAATQEGEEGEE
ncbi:hypothetical protein D3C78_1270870 [compost metagenome]